MYVDVHPPKPRRCKDCPWRCGRSGRPVSGSHPEFLYLPMATARAELWDGVRRGIPRLCPRAETITGTTRCVSPCTGALVLVARELETLERDFAGDETAYSRGHPDGLTAKGIERWRDYELGRPSVFDLDLDQPVAREHGMTPPWAPEVEHDQVSGVSRVRLRWADADQFGYGAARRDDCLRPAIATVLQIPPNEIPDPHLLERCHAGEGDADAIARKATVALDAWLSDRGLQITVHDDGMPDRDRWIGVCRPNIRTGFPFDDHCLVMSHGAVLWDPALALPAPPGKRLARFAPSSIFLGLTIDPKE